jgi:hypothetical protein
LKTIRKKQRFPNPEPEPSYRRGYTVLEDDLYTLHLLTEFLLEGIKLKRLMADSLHPAEKATAKLTSWVRMRQAWSRLDIWELRVQSSTSTLDAWVSSSG